MERARWINPPPSWTKVPTSTKGTIRPERPFLWILTGRNRPKADIATGGKRSFVPLSYRDSLNFAVRLR